MENWLSGSPIPGMIFWVILYVSDYYLTLSAAKGFKEIGHFLFEGGIELTPQYQKEINAQEKFSRKHISLLVLYTLFIWLLWWLFAGWLHLQWAYSLYLGMFILLELAIHVRHFRNLFLIRLVGKEGGVEGEIRYSRRLSYKISAFDLYIFSIFFLITSAIALSPFFLGGAIMCLGTGVKHSRYAKLATQTTTSSLEKNANPL